MPLLIGLESFGGELIAEIFSEKCDALSPNDAMLKRALSLVWSSDKGRGLDYEKWTKSQLILRILELEAGTPMESTPAPEIPSTKTSSVVNTPVSGTPATEAPKKKKVKPFDLKKHNLRFIALRFAYLGWNYNGLNYQYEPTPLPTVEELLLKALATAKLIADPEPGSCGFLRCGRTDKGVSAMNQVVSLKVRSSLSEDDQQKKECDVREIPYITILNLLLPVDVRVTAVCLRPPPKFDARFSTKHRHYRYLFKKHDLDLDLMDTAARKYEGRHDFRNFCKVDGLKQITNFKRDVILARIVPFDDDYYMLDLRGTAFLWHQVRCMVAVLLAVGQKLEAPAIVDELLDVKTCPARPLFEMANDIPLVLYDCIYEDMEWLTLGRDFGDTQAKLQREVAAIRGLVLDYEVKTKMVQMMEHFVMQDIPPLVPPKGTGYINIGDGTGRNFKKYTPFMRREFLETADAVNERYRVKKKRKLDSESVVSMDS